MKRLFLLLLISTFITTSFAYMIKQSEILPVSHAVSLSHYSTYNEAKKVAALFPDEQIYIGYVKSNFVIYIMNLKNKQSAQEKIEVLKHQYENAKYTIFRDPNYKPVIKTEILTQKKAGFANTTRSRRTLTTEEEKASTIANLIPNFDVPKNKLETEKTTKEESLHNDELFSPHAKSGFTLYEAVVYAVAHNPTLMSKKEIVIQERYRLKEKDAGHLPVLNLSGNSGYETRNAYTDDADSSGAIATDYFHYKKTELYLTMTENVWKGKSIENAIDEQKNRLNSEIFAYQESLEKVTLDTIKAYFDVVYRDIDLKINRKNMLNYVKILDIVTLKEKNGAATKGDVNFIKANVDNAKTELIKAESKYKDASAYYEYLMGAVDSYNIPYETDVVITTKDLNSTLNRVSDNYILIKKNQSVIKQMRYAFEAQKGAYHPSVDLQLNAETRNNFDVGEGSRNKANALFIFNYNLYNGGKDEAKSLRLYSKMNQYQHVLHDVQRKVKFETKVLHQSVKSLTESISLSESEVIAARKVVDSYWTAFKHGTQDLQALQLAQRNLNTAELNFSKYRSGVLVDYFKLLQKEGDILEYLDITYSKDPKEFPFKAVNIWK